MTLDPKLQAQFDKVQAELNALKSMMVNVLTGPAIPTGTSGSVTIADPAPAPQIIVDLDSVNVRADPTTASAILGQMFKGQTATVSTVSIDAANAIAPNGHAYLWYHLVNGGYVREDVVRKMGDWALNAPSAPVMIPAPALLPLPVRGILTNDHHTDGAHVHLGWDLSAPLGTPVLASEQGFVLWVKRCVPCGNEGKSRTDTGVLSDPAWNYGYGNYLVVRYREGVLPATTQQAYPGQHAFVMYAHLQSFSVSEERVLVRAGQEIAKLGSSGNSTGPHLHLEVRLSNLTNPSSWDSIRGGLVDPGVLFARS